MHVLNLASQIRPIQQKQWHTLSVGGVSTRTCTVTNVTFCCDSFFPGANCLNNKTSRWGNICTRTPPV